MGKGFKDGWTFAARKAREEADAFPGLAFVFLADGGDYGIRFYVYF